MQMTAETVSYRQSLEGAKSANRRCEPDFVTAFRKAAQARFGEVRFPTRKTELFKYMDLDFLDRAFVHTDTDLREYNVEALKRKGVGQGPGIHQVFLNGVFAAALSTQLKGKGVEFSTLSSALQAHAGTLRGSFEAPVAQETDPFVLINAAQFDDGAFLLIKENTHVEETIHYWFLSVGDHVAPAVYYPRNVFVLQKGAKARIVLHAMALAQSMVWMNMASEFHLADGAELEVVNLQEPERNTLLFHSQRAVLGEASRWNYESTLWGGAVTRNETQVRFTKPKASVSLKALAILQDASQSFNHVQVHHAVPECQSRQLYKNILSGKSVSEFSGLVHVYRGADKSDSDQLNRNLVLSEDAKAYSRPQLKIDADDVKCTHGATVGQLQQNELFYLKSRGIPEAQARALLTFGFAEEVIESLEPAELRRSLEAGVKIQLANIEA